MLPTYLKSLFWSYKFEDLDKEQDKSLIIFNILNYGNFQAWQWLLANYGREEIRDVVKKSTATAWFKQSLSLWQNVLGVSAKPYRFAGMLRPVDWPWTY